MTKLIIFLFPMVVGFAVYFVLKSNYLSSQLESSEQELESARKELTAYQMRESAAMSSRIALADLAQSCLDREKNAHAEAEKWKIIIDNMELRGITPQEKKEVPDDKTRANLLDALDEPL